MIYIKRKTKIKSERQDLKKIWKCIKAECKVYFKKKQLKELWEEFSQIAYCAGFILPNYGAIEEFITWLWLYKSNE